MKVGDRVRIIKDNTYDNKFLGWEGVIYAEIKDTYDYLVQFKETHACLHDGFGWLPSDIKPSNRNDCRCYDECDLELITDSIWTGNVGLTNAIDDFTARWIYADDIVCAKTSYDLRDVLSTIKGNNEENYMELLNIYEKRTEVAIDKKYDKKIKKVLAEDANDRIWQECFDKLAPLFEKNTCRTLSEYDVRRPEPLDDTKVKIKDLEQQRGDEMMKLRTTIREIEAQLCLCETRDDKLEVLRIYNVINDEGKINA